jgi:uncharacterized protein (DUF1778 family)
LNTRWTHAETVPEAHTLVSVILLAVRWPYGEEVPVTTTAKRTRSERLEVRTTPEDRALIDRAVAVTDSDLTDFVVSNLRIAAQRVLADRREFVLDDEQRRAWEQINRRPARTVAGLRDLMARPSPFSE